MAEELIQFFHELEDLQLREEGEEDGLRRLLAGTVIRYGDVAVVKTRGVVIREAIEPGCFGPVSQMDVTAVLQHERSKPLARSDAGLTLEDSPTRMRADIELGDDTDSRDAYSKYKRRILRGLSAEFLPIRSVVKDGVLRRQQAKLVRIGVVDRPAYADSVLEARAEEYLRLAPPDKRFWAF